MDVRDPSCDIHHTQCSDKRSNIKFRDDQSVYDPDQGAYEECDQDHHRYAEIQRDAEHF